ncbi:MAG: O-antigen export system permease protein RfbD [uncultured Chloroflexia bacterium]|uniref:Transport permease protein n=1 Tax=uncultured Chloroflexia bacterium TaxID=1672391 RepID=A0A6J4HB76_9CHLR|nr:MAG: O-antigen export system permease protein RfbD [uncultured Chloroflexia bacterium]
MARVAATGWVSGQVAPARLRLLHLLFMLFAALAAVAIAAPSVLTQRTLYAAQATVRWDTSRFPALAPSGAAGHELVDMQKQLGEILRDRYEGLGSRIRGLEYRVAGTDSIVAIAFTPSVSESVALADEAAAGLAQRIYASAGAPLLREILGHQLQASLEGHPPLSDEDVFMRRLILTSALHGGVAPSRGEFGMADLDTTQQAAVIRALEVQYDLTALDWRTADRQITTAGSEAEREDARVRRKGAQDALLAEKLALDYLYNTYGGAVREITAPGPAFVAAAATGADAIPAYRALKLAIAAAVGLLGGFFTVLLDRSVGIAAKLQELWAYRELIRNMVRRDLKARYKNSLLGYFWSLLNPLMTMLIFWLVFGVLLQTGIPMFPVFLIVALLPWNFAVTAVSGGMRSILDNAHLVKKVYFPREILPLTVVLANLVNYVLALPVMFLVMAAVQLSVLGHLQFSLTFAFLPVILAIQVIFLVGVSLLLSTVAIFFRDTTHIIDILIQLWIFLTPVFYSLEAVTRGNLLAAQVVRWLNPMASLVDFYRDILYGQATNPVPGLPALDGVFRTLLTALVILAIGAYVFHRNSSRFGEEL